MKCQFKHTILAVLSLIISGTSFGHGENKPGPNGGYIRMPGAFHTELVKGGNNGFKVYLLDLEWKNPTAKDSTVAVTIKSSRGEKKIECKPKKNHFGCSLPKDVKWNNISEIDIEANRLGSKGTATYIFPLQSEMSHSN